MCLRESKALEISWQQVEEIVDRALAEDSAWDDVTTQAIVPYELTGKASIVVKANGVLAGIEVAGIVFHRVDSSVRFDITSAEGKEMKFYTIC